MTQDDTQQLRLLSILHYVNAAFDCAIPIMGGLYAALGVAIVLGKVPEAAPKGSEVIGWVPIAMGAFVLLIGAAAVSLNIATARGLRDRKHHALCVLTSILNCMNVPIGTVLGTFTLVVLFRRSVRVEFESSSKPPAPPAEDTLTATRSSSTSVSM